MSLLSLFLPNLDWSYLIPILMIVFGGLLILLSFSIPVFRGFIFKSGIVLAGVGTIVWFGFSFISNLFEYLTDLIGSSRGLPIAGAILFLIIMGFVIFYKPKKKR